MELSCSCRNRLRLFGSSPASGVVSASSVLVGLIGRSKMDLHDARTCSWWLPTSGSGLASQLGVGVACLVCASVLVGIVISFITNSESAFRYFFGSLSGTWFTSSVVDESTSS
jgi:hypothetical protein